MTGEREHTYQFEYSQGKETEPQTDADVQEIASALQHFDSIQSYHLANVKHSTGE
ncbi:MAG: hypothetical protein MJ233_02930 [Mycoplasmoidaceae bacterium]|nr:hypothetical protein [Mycoplasmoidaceae bacterium]